MSRYLEGLRCRVCEARYPAEVRSVCDECFGPVEPFHDEERLRAELTRTDIENGPRSLWRYEALLPAPRNPDVDLGDGWAPPPPARRLGAEPGLPSLYLKDETRNPTHSFKDRVVSVALTKAVEFGYGTVGCASTGNLANAVAAHAAAAGRGVGGDGVRQVPGRRAADGSVSELHRLGQRDGDDAVLERVRRVPGFVLQVQAGKPGLGAEPPGGGGRRPAVTEVDVGVAGGGEQRLVPPQRPRAVLDVGAGELRPEAFLVVERLDRAEALVTDRAHLGRVPGLADLTPQSFQVTRHGVLLTSPRRAVPETEEARRLRKSRRASEVQNSPHLSGGSITTGRNWHPADRGCRGFTGPVPPPLWMRLSPP